MKIMNITLKETLELEVIKMPFEVFFAWTKKRGEKNEWWFTPSGKGKIYAGALHTKQLGLYTNEDEKLLIKEMKKYHSDFLVDSSGEYYTITSGRISRVTNAHNLLVHMSSEWNARKDIEGWEAINLIKSI